MDIKEYLEKMAYNLRMLPESELEQLLEYYEGYLSDAPDLQAAMEEIGTPEECASRVMGEYLGQGKQFHGENVAGKKTRVAASKSSLSILWISIISLFALPIALPVAISVASVAFAVIVSIGAIVFAFGATSVSLVFTGILVSIVSVFLAITAGEMATAIFSLGVGLFVVGVGVMFWYLATVTFKILKYVSVTIGKIILKSVRSRKNA